MKPGVVIVGAGHGGVQVAASMRQEGYDGSVTLVSDETELPYHKPPLSKSFLKVSEAEAQILKPESFYRDKAIDLMLGAQVESIDRRCRCIRLRGGANLEFSHLVLATGARPRIPPLPGVELAGVLPLRSFADACALRDALASAGTVVIIGGGFIGMEIAHTLIAVGKSVTLVETASRVLGRSAAPQISLHAQKLANAAGIGLRLGTGVAAIEGNGITVSHVRLADGTRLASDLVILGTGVLPNTALAEQADLRIADGIVVDSALRTSDPHILAIGDVAAFHHWQPDRTLRLESVQNATDHARHCARTITGHVAPFREVPWFWSDMGSTKLQTAGVSFEANRHVLHGNPDEDDFSVWHFAGARLVSVDSINRAGDHMIARKLIASGVHPTETDICAGRERLKELVNLISR